MRQTQEEASVSTFASPETTSSTDFLKDPNADPLVSQANGTLDGGGTKNTPKLYSSLPGVTNSGNTGVSVANAKQVEADSRSEPWLDDNPNRVPGKDPKKNDKRNDHFEHFDKKGNWNQGWTLESAPGPTKGSTAMGMAGVSDANQKTEMDKTGVHTVAEYRRVLRADFNFGGLVEDYAPQYELVLDKKTGKKKPQVRNNDARFNESVDKFIAAVVNKFYPGLPWDNPDVKVGIEIARNIWSYAVRGYDIAKHTDIGEMQGLLYVFDKQIKTSSDSNTKMSKDEFFIVPGTEDWDTPVKLRKGDGKHGRATTLTTRHLLGNMTEDNGEPPELKGFDENFLLMDSSGSMVRDEYGKLSKIIAAGGIDGEVGLAGFTSDRSTLRKYNGGEPMPLDDAATVLGEVSKGWENAGPKSMHMSSDDKGAESIGNIQGSTLPSNDPGYKTGAHGPVEQGLANALAWIKSMQAKPGKLPPKSRQLIIFTDEPDASPEVFDELLIESSKIGVTIKVVFSYGKSPAYGEFDDDPNYKIIDLSKIPKLKSEWFTKIDGHKVVMWDRVAATQGAPEMKWADL